MAEKALEVVLSARDEASKKIEKVDNSLKGMLKTLKGSLGEESSLGMVGKLFSGTGPVSGLTSIVGSVERVTESLAKLRQEWRAGTLDLPDAFQNLAGSLPIIGEFAKAGANIREFLFEERAQAEAIRQDSEAQLHVMELRVARQKLLNDQAREYGDILRKIRNEATIGAARPFDQPRIAAETTAEEEQIGLGRAEENRRAARRAAAKAENDERIKLINSLRSQVDNFGTGFSVGEHALGEYAPLFGKRNPGDYEAGKENQKRLDNLKANLRDQQALLNRSLRQLGDEDKRGDAALANLKGERAAADAAGLERIDDESNRRRIDAADQFRHTIQKVRDQTTADALKGSGNNVLGQLAELRTKTTEGMDAFRKTIEDAVREGSIFPDIGDDLINQNKSAARANADQAARQLVGEDIINRGLALIPGIGDKLRDLKDKAATQFRRSFGLTGIQRPSEDPYQPPGYTPPNLSPNGGLTGLANAVAERFNAGADPLVEAEKKAQEQRAAALKKQDEMREALTKGISDLQRFLAPGPGVIDF